MGALLVANSWGPGWGGPNMSGVGGGFVWVAYDFALQGPDFKQGWFNPDRPRYRPRLVASLAASHPVRDQVSVRGAVGRATAPRFTSYYPVQQAGGSATPVSVVACDLTDGIADLDSQDTLYTELAASSLASVGASILTSRFLHDLGR